LALRHLAEERVDLELICPEPQFWYRPLAVVEPFGLGQVRGLDLSTFASRIGSALTLGSLTEVDVDARVALTSSGAAFPYDALLVATGARAVPAIPGALTFRGGADGHALKNVLGEVEGGAVRRIVFAVPGGVTWPLPLYELALMTATFAAERGLDPEL